MGHGLAAFVAGFGGGYLQQTRQNKLDAERQEDRVMVKQKFDAEMSDVNDKQKLKNSLSDAAKPATVINGTAVTDGSGNQSLYKAPLNQDDSESMQAESDMRAEQRGVPALPITQKPAQGLMAGGISSRIYSDPAQAGKDMGVYNTPDALQARQAQSYADAGQPLAALQLSEAGLKLNNERDAYGRRIKDEGVIDASKALRMGDGAGMKSAFNKSGKYTIQGDPVITPVTKNVPGLGDIQTYNAKFNVVGPDGAPREMNINSHELSMETMPFEKQHDALLKGKIADNKADYNDERIKNLNSKLDMQGMLGIGGRGAGGGAGKAVDPNKLLDDAWDRSNTGDAKLPPDQLMTGRRLTEQLVTNSGGKVKPALAAEIAYNVTKDPKLVQPAINNVTGDIEGVYKHPTLGDVKIDDLQSTARSPGDYKPEQMKSMANTFVSKLSPSDRTTLVGAAFDQAKTTTLMTDMYAAIDQAAAKRRQDNPNITDAQSASWAAQTKRDTQSSIQKKLDLISLHADRPKASATAKPDAKPGGITTTAGPSQTPGPGLGLGFSADAVPPPPPKNLPSSTMSAGKINPEYTAWQERYGAAQTKQNELRASQEAAKSLAAKKSYNPYAQNSVK